MTNVTKYKMFRYGQFDDGRWSLIATTPEAVDIMSAANDEQSMWGIVMENTSKDDSVVATQLRIHSMIDNWIDSYFRA